MLSNEVSTISVVPSGIVQGSVFGPTFFTVFIDSLLCKLSHLIPKQLSAFDDDLKFVTRVDDDSNNLAQEAIAIVYEWSESHGMPLSTDKNVVEHCGAKNPKCQYKLGSSIRPTVLQFKDLDVLRSERRPYSEHIEILSTSCHRLAGKLKRVFKSHDVDLLRTALKKYVILKIMYASPAWSPLAKQDIVSLERVQRRFTKPIRNFAYLTFELRLKALNTLSLEDSAYSRYGACM